MINSYGDEFEVTEADRALVAPLGTPPELAVEDQPRLLAEALKSALHDPRTLGQVGVLPYGRWDAHLDEADAVHDNVAHPDCDPNCCIEDHLEWRSGSSERDDVFVRLTTEVGDSPVWDIEVFTRPRVHAAGVDIFAMPCINGEEYTPEQCLTDLGALLAVFRLFVQQGEDLMSKFEDYNVEQFPIMPVVPMEIKRLCPGYCGWDLAAGNPEYDYELLVKHLFTCARGYAAYQMLRHFAWWVLVRNDTGARPVHTSSADEMVREFFLQPNKERYT